MTLNYKIKKKYRMKAYGTYAKYNSRKKALFQ